MISRTVDLWFPMLGRSLPSDHGYALYGSLSSEVPDLHGARWWGLHTVPGTPRGDGDIVLSRRPSMGLRLPADRISTVLPLAGRKLDVAGHAVRLSPPTVRLLQPASAVSARIVTIKGFMEADPFRAAVERQLHDLRVEGTVEVGPRKVVQVRRHTVVGFSVRITEIPPAESLRLQEAGIGGRRRFGCGLFNPSEAPLTPDRIPGDSRH